MTDDDKGKVWKTIPFDQEVEFDGTTYNRLELRPLRGAHLFFSPVANVSVGDIWTIGGLMAGLSREAARHVLSELGPRPLARLAEAVNEALEPYNRERRDRKWTFDTRKAFDFVPETPVRQASEVVEKITLRPLRGADVWNLSGAGALTPAALVDVAVNQSGVPAVVFGRLTGADFGRLLGVIDHFLGAFQQAG